MNTEMIQPRVRLPLGERRAPPDMAVISIPLAFAESVGIAKALEQLLYATPPGWRWEPLHEPADASDAIACVKHQAGLRGDRVEVMEEGGAYNCPVVIIGRVEDRGPGRTVVLCMVRFFRT